MDKNIYLNFDSHWLQHDLNTFGIIKIKIATLLIFKRYIFQIQIVVYYLSYLSADTNKISVFQN